MLPDTFRFPFDNERLAPGAVMTGSNLPGVSALLQEPPDHAERNPVAMGHFLPTTLLIIIGSQNPLA
jgi:hypothetical protein